MGQLIGGALLFAFVGVLFLFRPIICFFNPGVDYFFYRCARSRTPNPRPTTPAPTPSPGPFNIRLINMGVVTEFDGEVQEAAQRWERVITGDQPDVTFDRLNGDLFQGMFGETPVSEDVDDLTIGYTFTDLGESATFGNGGPIFVRQSTGAPITGGMRFDYRFFLSQNPAVNIALITHQIGHILGIGTLWRDSNCVNTCFNNDFGEVDPYECAQANAVYNALNFGLGGLRVSPDCMHFSEDSFPGGLVWSEVMTSMFNPAVQQLITPVSIAGLMDVAQYEVDLAAADRIPAAVAPPVDASLSEPLDLSIGLAITTDPIPVNV